MLNRTQKAEVVNGLKDSIEKANAVFLTNLIGLSANDSVGLRKELRSLNSSVTVTRNSLFRRASEGTSCEEMLSSLKGPHAVAFAFEDAASVAKCLKDASDNYGELIELKAGVLRGEQLSKESLVQLANLPSREQMLATLLATFNAPVSAFVRVLNAIKEEKGQDDVASGETEATESEEN